MPRWRRKAIPRSDSPWTPQGAGNGLPPPRGVRRRSYSDDQGGWLIGPTWLYISLAVAIFVAAAALAIVRASGSNDDASQAAAQPQPGAQESSVTQVATQAPQAGQQTADPDQAQQAAAVEPQDQQQDATVQPGPQQAESTTDADHPLRGFRLPIAGACVSQHEGHLPGADRAYRNHGVHEGLDFYQWASCTTVDELTPILAAKAGVVIRADLDYVDITPADWARFEAANWEGEAILDELRGRQVWIDHGRGVVTRYAHLSAIAQGIGVGVEVEPGQIIGYPGESGQREVYTDENDVHLHFEIRIADGWLGQGETPQQSRQRYLDAFGLSGN